ncbi:hypothetical protein GCM10009830_43540 [Glycomyces endophyticus]|uniref:DUF3558 domain-containing protein n=1 Tax=Glycomyces endophyticus TaxID=480996 RepID=A0ABP4TNL6_9ACTN
MTYPSQPGYPSPYGQQPPPGGQQQNSLWLIGGSIVLVLVILMTVVLLVVQQSQNDDSADGGSDGGSEGTDGGGDEGGDEGTDHSGMGTVEINADACAAFDLSTFEAEYGSYSPDDTYTSSSTTGGLASVTCQYYNEDYTSVYITVTDWEDASDVVDWVNSDADYYNEENGYTMSEYTDFGDAGTLYSTDYGDSGTTTLHVALGSLDVSTYTTLYEAESISNESGVAVLEDFVRQADVLFADYK